VVSDLVVNSDTFPGKGSTDPDLSSDSIASSPMPGSDSLTVPDLLPLKVSVMLREAVSDPARRICQYEIPGGGSCRDSSCSDLHAGDFEPSEHEIAQYLLETMGTALQDFNETEIVDQLLQVRQMKTTSLKTAGDGASTNPIRLEDIVSEALATLTGRQT